MRRVIPILWVVAGVTAGCTAAPKHGADVELEINGVPYRYSTHSAQLDQQITDGPYSVYLLRDDTEADEAGPYVCLRTFAGNPVSHLWVRYRPPSADGAPSDTRLRIFDCFVPGTLKDGRQTAGWKNDDGTARDRTETGEEGCRGEVVAQGGALQFHFAGTLKGEGGDKKTVDGVAAAAEKIVVSGRATVRLDGAKD